MEQAFDWLQEYPGRGMWWMWARGRVVLQSHWRNEWRMFRVIACDISAPALRVARDNAQRHDVVDRVTFVRSDLLSAIRGEVDLICANLPYIPTLKLQELEVARHEPRLALDGGDDGVELIARLVDQARTRLAPGGLMLLEIEATAAGEALPLVTRLFPKGRVELLPDLAGLDRLIRLENSVSL